FRDLLNAQREEGTWVDSEFVKAATRKGGSLIVLDEYENMPAAFREQVIIPLLRQPANQRVLNIRGRTPATVKIDPDTIFVMSTNRDYVGRTGLTEQENAIWRPVETVPYGEASLRRLLDRHFETRLSETSRASIARTIAALGELARPPEGRTTMAGIKD